MTSIKQNVIGATLETDTAQSVCPVQCAKKFDNPIRRIFHNPAKMFANYIKPGMQVLDLGCGLGFFSIGMAHLVGEAGEVNAVDLQQGMLDILMSRAASNSIEHRIRPVLCSPDSIGIAKKVDFALAFWMMHEVPDTGRTLQDLYKVLNPKGVLYIAEPKFHVSRNRFDRMIAIAEEIGFKVIAKPQVNLSNAVVLGV